MIQRFPKVSCNYRRGYLSTGNRWHGHSFHASVEALYPNGIKDLERYELVISKPSWKAFTGPGITRVFVR
jgi:hypothetical protein